MYTDMFGNTYEYDGRNEDQVIDDYEESDSEAAEYAFAL